MSKPALAKAGLDPLRGNDGDALNPHNHEWNFDGGGDCRSERRDSRGIKTASKMGWSTLGIGRFEGLLNRSIHGIELQAIGWLVGQGGTILGTTNRGRFAAKARRGGWGKFREILDEAKEILKNSDCMA